MDRRTEFDYILKFAEQDGLSYRICFNQLRSLWTAYCLHHDLTPDTMKYDSDIALLWKTLRANTTSPWNYAEEDGVNRFELFDLAMGAYLC